MEKASSVARPDEDEIKLGLLGSDEEKCQAIETVYQHYHERVMAFIVSNFTGLSHDLAAHAMVETFQALFESVTRGKFDFDQPLEAFLFCVARRKAIDQQRIIENQPVSLDDFYERVGQELSGTEVAELWRKCREADRATWLQHEFLTFLETLPWRQRQVAQVVADQLPIKLNEADISEEVFRRTGERPTVVEVKSALSQIRQKFRKLLDRRGP